MKITKSKTDKEKEVVKFVCGNCGCEFETNDPSEYYEEVSISLTTYPEKHNVYASCPECHKICKSSVGFNKIVDYKTLIKGTGLNINPIRNENSCTF